VDERLNENCYPLHSVLKEIQETNCDDLVEREEQRRAYGLVRISNPAERQFRCDLSAPHVHKNEFSFLNFILVVIAKRAPI
jgi:phenylalanine-4-hydroxylase